MRVRTQIDRSKGSECTKALCGPILIATTAVMLLIWSWGKWPDVLVDFGRELYVPWRITEGDVLYRDIAYFNGPLSAYFNALCFSLFGVGLRTLVFSNLIILGLLAAMLYRLFVDVADQFAATVALLTFFVAFAFAHYSPFASNYVCPYSHELVHGLVTAVGSIFCLRGYLRDGRCRWLAGSGLLLGATWLTKPETFVAALVAVSTGVVVKCCGQRHKRSAADVLVCLGSALVGPVGAFAALHIVADGPTAWSGLVGPWPFVFDNRLAHHDFYRNVMGTLNWGENMVSILKYVLGYGAVIVSAMAASLGAGRARSGQRMRIFIGGAAAIVIGTLFAVLCWHIEWPHVTRPLQIFALAAVVFSGITVAGKRKGGSEWTAKLRLVMAVFALMMLLKVFFTVNLYNYGFVLTMPAALLFVVALLSWLPQWIGWQGGRGSPGVFRAVIIGVLVVVLSALLVRSDSYYKDKIHVVASGPDRFLADPRGKIVSAALNGIKQLLRPGDTFVAMPEGVTLNYLSRHRNPTPYYTFLPPEVLMFKEDTMLSALRSNPPHYIFLVHRDTSEYGTRWFGRDYAQSIYAWLEANYIREGLPIGSEPFVDERIGVAVLKRK